MDYNFTYRKRAKTSNPETVNPAQGPSLEALRSGAAAPTREQMGRRVDLPDAMREKMEASFGADLSAVRLYESEAVAEAGAGAMARGSDIAFAPGMLDFTSFGGQALLGHELSHVVSQARGEVTGGGYLENASLEARADREGAMAAAGQTVSAPTASLSPVSAAAAAGPMQAGHKGSTPQQKVKDSQAKQQDAVLSMIDLQKAGKQDTRGYRSKQKQLDKARKQEQHWRGQLSDQANRAIGSTDSKVLAELGYRNDDGKTDVGEYVDDMDRALGIMGISPDRNMHDYLQHEVSYRSAHAGRGQDPQRGAAINASLDRFKSKYGLI